MVQTRRQYRSWVEERQGRRHTAGSESSQSSQGSFGFSQDDNGSQDSSMFDGVSSGNRASYAPNDHCKRHRKPDDEAKTKNVGSYSRRPARR